MTNEMVRFISYFILVFAANIYVGFIEDRCKSTKEKVISFSLFLLCLICAYIFGAF